MCEQPEPRYQLPCPHPTRSRTARRVYCRRTVTGPRTMCLVAAWCVAIQVIAVQRYHQASWMIPMEAATRSQLCLQCTFDVPAAHHGSTCIGDVIGHPTCAGHSPCIGPMHRPAASGELPPPSRLPPSAAGACVHARRERALGGRRPRTRSDEITRRAGREGWERLSRHRSSRARAPSRARSRR